MEILVKVYPFVFGAGLLLLVMLQYGLDCVDDECQDNTQMGGRDSAREEERGEFEFEAAIYALVRASARGSYLQDAGMLGRGCVLGYGLVRRGWKWGRRVARRRMLMALAMLWLALGLAGRAVRLERVAKAARESGNRQMQAVGAGLSCARARMRRTLDGATRIWSFSGSRVASACWAGRQAHGWP